MGWKWCAFLFPPILSRIFRVFSGTSRFFLFLPFSSLFFPLLLTSSNFFLFLLVSSCFFSFDLISFFKSKLFFVFLDSKWFLGTWYIFALRDFFTQHLFQFICKKSFENQLPIRNKKKIYIYCTGHCIQCIFMQCTEHSEKYTVYTVHMTQCRSHIYMFHSALEDCGMFTPQGQDKKHDSPLDVI